jgi:uncharacterized protein YoxC
MFSTSGDILNLIIAVCIVALTIFLCVSLYYLISTVKKTHQVINALEKGVSKTQEVIDIIHGKIKNGSAYLMLVAELVKKGFEVFLNKQKKEKTEEEPVKEAKKKTKKKKSK